MWDTLMNLFDNVVDDEMRNAIGTNAFASAQTALEIGYKIDNVFMVKSAGLGFLDTDKTSPYPWMMAACAVTPGAMPLCLTFFTFIWIECSRDIYGIGTCMGG